MQDKQASLFKKTIRGVTLFLMLFLAPLGAHKKVEQDASLLMVGVGAFDIFRWSKGKTNFEPLLFIEARPFWPLYKKNKVFIRPTFGWMVPDFNSNYIYAGLAFDFFTSHRIVITPSFAPGYWFKSSHIDLGYPLEFRTSLEVAYRFTNKGRLGVMFSHISNAHLGVNNPGADMFSIYYSIPLDFLSRKNRL